MMESKDPVKAGSDVAMIGILIAPVERGLENALR